MSQSVTCLAQTSAYCVFPSSFESTEPSKALLYQTSHSLVDPGFKYTERTNLTLHINETGCHLAAFVDVHLKRIFIYIWHELYIHKLNDYKHSGTDQSFAPQKHYFLVLFTLNLKLLPFSLFLGFLYISIINMQEFRVEQLRICNCPQQYKPI